MSNSEALIRCKDSQFDIKVKEISRTKFSYPIYEVHGSHQKPSKYCVHPNRPNVALRTEQFSQDLETWLDQNHVFSPTLFFVRNNLVESQLTGFDRIPIALPGLSAQWCHPGAYYQVAVLSTNGFKLIKAIIKAVETLHRRPDYYRGDLSCLNSYVVREVFTTDSYRRSVLHIDVCLTPGHYDGGGDFNRTGDFQKLDVRQLKKLLFETILKLPKLSHFTNHQEKVAGPRLPQSFEDLKLCFDAFQIHTLESKGWNTKAKGQFYHHYAIMDPVDRIMEINSSYDYYLKSHLGNPKNIPGNGSGWEQRIKKMKGSPLQKFLDDKTRDFRYNHIVMIPRHYSSNMGGLLKFLKHVLTHIGEKSYAPEFKDADYLELVLAEVFHGLYGNFFD